jgi:hypothetical protein
VLIGVDRDCNNILMHMALGETDYGAALIIFKWEDFQDAKAELQQKQGSTMSDIERKYRYRLWMAYPGNMKYGDDGEMQADGKDFLRAPLDKLEEALDAEMIEDFKKSALIKKTPSPEKEYDKSIHSNPDADAWARFYKSVHPDADLDDMRGWFANAMMAMHDHLLSGPTIFDETNIPVHPEPLPVSDWPANCDACTLNEELIGGDDCSGCPNDKKMRWSKPGDPERWPPAEGLHMSVTSPEATWAVDPGKSIVIGIPVADDMVHLHMDWNTICLFRTSMDTIMDAHTAPKPKKGKS